MSYIKFLRYVGIALVLFSLTIGFMLDLGFFDPQEVKTPVFTSFCSFIIGITFLIYADNKLK
jgi:cation transporter-like permease